MKMVTCPKCKAANMQGTKTCTRCQSPLLSGKPKAATPARREAPRSAPQRRKKRRPSRPMVKPVAWLCSDSLAPTALFPSSTLKIGRDQSVDLSLPDAAVSRLHGQIVVGRATITYQDEGSANGSLLNGEDVTTAPLQIGDSLVLGPYEFVLRGPGDLTEADILAQTATRRVKSAVHSRRKAALSGLLEEVPLGEILQSMELNGRTGTLTVESSTSAGEMLIRNGAPLSARLGQIVGREGKVSGREAILAMMALEEGSFSLVRQDPADLEGDPMPFSLTSLFLEGFRRKDQLEEDMDSLFSDGQLIRRSRPQDVEHLSSRKTVILKGDEARQLLEDEDAQAEAPD